MFLNISRTPILKNIREPLLLLFVFLTGVYKLWHYSIYYVHKCINFEIIIGNKIFNFIYFAILITWHRSWETVSYKRSPKAAPGGGVNKNFAIFWLSPGGLLNRRWPEKFCKSSRENIANVSFIKNLSETVLFLWVLWNFSKQLFCRTNIVRCVIWYHLQNFKG